MTMNFQSRLVQMLLEKLIESNDLKTLLRVAETRDKAALLKLLPPELVGEVLAIALTKIGPHGFADELAQNAPEGYFRHDADGMLRASSIRSFMVMMDVMVSTCDAAKGLPLAYIKEAVDYAKRYIPNGYEIDTIVGQFTGEGKVIGVPGVETTEQLEALAQATAARMEGKLQ